MRFQNVVIESLVAVLPPQVLTTAALEERLRPLYERLRLPFGRLELMTGIKERRFWEPGTKPSEASARAVRAVLAKDGGAGGEARHAPSTARSRATCWSRRRRRSCIGRRDCRRRCRSSTCRTPVSVS
jgi:hypothetical protein